MEIALSLCHVCPAADTTETAKILLHCFKVKNKLVPLLDYLIDKEVKTTGKAIGPYFVDDHQ